MTRIVYVACKGSYFSYLINLDRVGEIRDPEGERGNAMVTADGTSYDCAGRTFAESLRTLNIEDGRVYWA